MVDTSRDPTLLEPQLLRLWEHAEAAWNASEPHRVFLTATYRGPRDQQAAYDAGRSKARFGESLHNYSPAYAFDVAFLRPDGGLDWNLDTFARFAALLKPEGLVWGGDWSIVDGPHFQLPMSVEDASLGRVPRLASLIANPAAPADRLLVVENERGYRFNLPIPAGHDVLVRSALERGRVYVTIKPT